MKKQRGFTLIELMVVIAIAAIMASLAAPSFSDFINRTRLTSTMSQLSSDLNRARSEAIKRNSWVLVCARGTDTACGASWGNGWLVCYDGNQDGACDATSATNPNPIALHQAISPNLAFNPPPAVATIRFNPNGTGGPGTLKLVSGTESRTANIAVTGNISVSNP